MTQLVGRDEGGGHGAHQRAGRSVGVRHGEAVIAERVNVDGEVVGHRGVERELVRDLLALADERRKLRSADGQQRPEVVASQLPTHRSDGRVRSQRDGLESLGRLWRADGEDGSAVGQVALQRLVEPEFPAPRREDADTGF